MKIKSILLLSLILTYAQLESFAQLGKCKGKYLGNITAYSVPSGYTSLWNQTTSENGSKWGSCDKGNGRYDFSNSDLAFNTAKNSGGLFKFHALIWGAQAPSYLKNASAAEIETAIRKWFQAVEDHYAPMGGLEFIDVLNEPVNTAINKEVGNLKAALTRGFQAEPANANDKNNPYGWAIWPFQLARKHFPDATLLINEFNTEHNWNNCRAEYITMSNAIKNAPNLTDGKKNCIDGIGLQAHGMNGDQVLSAAGFKGCIDEIWNKTGLPLHITELDLVVKPNEAAQRDKLKEFFTIAWEHPHVAGVTFWGYIEGSTWISGSGMVNNNQDRPSMTWLKQYMESQPDLPCCPDPAPFGDCKNGMVPTIEFTSPTETLLIAPASVTIDVEAKDEDGTITSVKFYINDKLVQEKTSAPYSFDYTFETEGKYIVRAVATDDSENESEAILTISANIPQGPYKGTAVELPGKLELENYDVGGNGFAYNDNDEGTNVEDAPDFRTNEDVDIENCTDEGGGYNLGWTANGEWLEYTVNVTQAGKYDLIIRASSDGDDKSISLSSGEEVIVPNIDIPNTGGWQEWVDVPVKEVELEAGEQILRLTITGDDFVNLNYIIFDKEIVPEDPIMLSKGWNLIGFPYKESQDLETAFSEIWEYVEVVKNMDVFYRKSQPEAFNLLTKLEYSGGYMIYVSEDCELNW